MTEKRADSIPEADPVQSAVNATDRLLATMAELDEPQAPAERPAAFEAPPEVQEKLDAAQREYEEAWEVESAKSTPQTSEQIRAKLAKRGLFPNPPTAEEVEEAERQANTEARTQSAAANTSLSQKTPRGRSPRRDNRETGPSAKRAETDYR